MYKNLYDAYIVTTTNSTYSIFENPYDATNAISILSNDNSIISEPYYFDKYVYDSIYRKTTKEILDELDVKEIEQYLREKKLQNIKNNNEK